MSLSRDRVLWVWDWVLIFKLPNYPIIKFLARTGRRQKNENKILVVACPTAHSPKSTLVPHMMVLPHCVLVPHMMVLLHIVENPDEVLVPHIIVEPHMPVVPHMMVEPPGVVVPHMIVEPLGADVPHIIVLPPTNWLLPQTAGPDHVYDVPHTDDGSLVK